MIGISNTMPAKSRVLELVNSILRHVSGERSYPPGMKVGRGTYVDDTAVFDRWHGRHITIGDYVTISSGVRIICHDASSRRRIGATWIAPVTIRSRAFVGANAVILPGTDIGEDAVIAAGAVVKGKVNRNTIVAGVPAVVKGLVNELDKRRSEDMKAKPLFDESVYNTRVMDKSHYEELDYAAQIHGGYYLIDPEITRTREKQNL